MKTGNYIRINNMILVDTALKQLASEGRSIKVGMIGAGFMGKGATLQIEKYVNAMELVAIANRNLASAESVFKNAEVNDIKRVTNLEDLNSTIASGARIVTTDPELLCQADSIDVILEMTGAIEYGVTVILTAIKNKKHVVSMNAEVDATVGPVLKKYADEAGVIYTISDGDQPGVTMNLYRFVQGIGVKPVLCGNIKGLQDRYRNPTTQESFAKQWGQTPHMVTSFADGTKISFEQAVIANATGMRVGIRGMHGPTVPVGTNITDCADLYPIEELINGPGVVDYIVGATPAPGVFILGTCDNPTQAHYLNYYKLGEGPLYCFYVPYHLCHMEIPNSIARAVLFNDPTIVSRNYKPQVDVVATAKTNLKAGQQLDGIGYYMTYGLAENYDIANSDRLLPMGLAEGCILKRDIPKDQVISYDDVKLPDGRLIDKLRHEQNQLT
jgi:predicted homoserine dehydrogenase-like protein